MRNSSDLTSNIKDKLNNSLRRSSQGSVRDSLRESQQKIGRTGRSVAQKLFDDKEQARQIFKDEVYTLEDWRQAKKWWRHLPTFGSVRLLRGYFWIVAFHTAVAILVCSYHYWLESVGAPSWGGSDDMWQAFSVTSFALALLLVFRTNSAYGRWWEARILWGLQINMTRNITRMAVSWFPQQDEALLTMFARWSVVMSFALKGNLRGENLASELQRMLPAEELKWADESSHLCTTTAQMLADIIYNVEIHEFKKFKIDSELQRYLDIVGNCERILKTPIHRNWTSHTVRFCIIWLTFLPFALWPIYGWASPGIEFVISFLLIGIENIGVQIEEPFAVLALDSYCGACERSVQQLMRRRHGSKSLVKAVRNQATSGRSVSFSPSRQTGSTPEFTTALQTGYSLDHRAGSKALPGTIDLTEFRDSE